MSGVRIDWCHDTDSSGRARSYSRNTWPLWVIVWEADPGQWRWQHIPAPGETSGSAACADRFAGMAAAQEWFDSHVRRLSGVADPTPPGEWPWDRLGEPGK